MKSFLITLARSDVTVQQAIQFVQRAFGVSEGDAKLQVRKFFENRA